ncbi:hypothetical protein LEP1GSC082_3465 [Leptospira kirschneri str. H2]|uniref:Uncharacterized protein n=2 Tax=Leptospira kirschneri TaxID=29507 RepID=A0A0E2B4H7_9LEPT|nr:hypothetical protein LEP1GSC081_3305 [Leptospira kirschneri str. H1]EKO60485.1 hypothetical protein LEP1GSC082_3465 [Leptospira kirschneri str. H2]EMK24975.1 hypothetical protein LEP1GSC008_3101 [Leptospira kirschneri serovar Bulgarica str. Nikolaevo]
MWELPLLKNSFSFSNAELTLNWDLNFDNGRKNGFVQKSDWTMILFYFIIVPTIFKV